jgi:hypothetical protein
LLSILPGVPFFCVFSPQAASCPQVVVCLGR